LEILQEHIDSNHLPIENPDKRDNSPGFFDKIKNLFTNTDKKDKNKLVKCERCAKNVKLSLYEKHIRACRIPSQSNQLFSLMGNQGRVLIRQNPNNPLRNDMNELDAEARKMRELMLLMQLLLSQKPQEEKGLNQEEIENYSILCHYKEMEKNVGLNEDYKKCSICQCDFELNEEVRIINCMHRFHKECADAWFKKKSWCPLCRKNVKGGEEEQGEEEN